jgi:molybdopterin molybdotransferase
MQSEVPMMISVDEAQRVVLTIARERRLPAETLALASAHRRHLAQDVLAPRDVPPFPNSAMDGFAVRAEDLPADGEAWLRIIGTRLAGDATPASIASGECLRITTGAPLPLGANTVVIKERARVDGEQLVVSAGEKAGQHVRAAGEDFRSGSTALHKGCALGAAQLGVLASLGLPEIAVGRQPRVMVMTTGDELVLPGMTCGYGQIFNSNGFSLGAMVQQTGALLRTPLGETGFMQVRDDPELLRQVLLDAAKDADVIITSGGVSAGEADHLPTLLQEIGRVHFWKVRMRPGMPVLCGEIGRTLVFSLPGNPVSSIATFLQFVRPALLALQGASEVLPALCHARITQAISKRHDRTEFLRAHLESREDGTLAVTALSMQGSGMLRGVAAANALIVVDEAVRELAKDAVVPVLPLSMAL